MSEANPYHTGFQEEKRKAPFYFRWWFWLLAVVFLLVGSVAVVIVFVVGMILYEQHQYNEEASRQEAVIQEYLDEDPEAYGDLSVEHASNGWAYPTGTVSTQADHDRLAEHLEETFGHDLAERMMYNVEVEVGEEPVDRVAP